MKQFNLEEYLKNPTRKVITRGGSPVKIHCTNYTKDQLIIAEIEGTNLSASFNKDGKWLNLADSEKDLFFAPIKKEGWINLYKINSIVSPGPQAYNTKEEAESAAGNRSDYISTIKIKWEE